jgi:CxxC motif-containing protein (DUF1111 family)
MTSVRNAPPLFGDGRIDTIPDAIILAGAAAQEVPGQPRLNGHANLTSGRVGRFGWKADTASLAQFVGDAFRNELGLTNPAAPVDIQPASAAGCGRLTGDPELAGSIVADVAAYLASLPAPTSSGGDPTVFTQLGCGACHVPDLGGVPLYSDLLLHDMGGALNDGVIQNDARGQDWRTTPLWGLAQRQRFLHDGRARTIEAAILAHGGQADPVVQRFRALPPAERSALLAFLSTL